MKQLSIIIPVYNVEQYVYECLNSVFKQGLDEDSFEVIIINDGTEDNSMNDLCFEEGTVDEDLLWSYLVFLYARNVLIVPKVTYTYAKGNPNNITNTSEERISQIVKSRTILCKRLLDNPPHFPWPEYYAYVFFVLTRGINLLEYNGIVGDLRSALYSQRKRLLKEVKSKRYYLLYIFFYTSVKPFFNLTKLRLFRRYFDRLSKMFISLTYYFNIKTTP